MKLNVPIGKKELYLRTGIRNQQTKCFGMTNKTPFGFVYFADHDSHEINRLLDDYAVLADEYDLGYVYLFQTREDERHLQAISPVILQVGELCEVMDKSKCERNFMGIGLTNGFWTLRIFEKDDRVTFKEPVLKYVIKRESKHNYSTAHLEYIVNYCGGLKPNKYKRIATNMEVLRYYTNNFQRRSFI
jgi:hypothetical protein